MATKKQRLPLDFWFWLVAIVGMFAVGAWLLKDAYVPVLMPSGAVANQQKQLLLFTVALALIVVIPVYILLGIFAWRYRDKNKTAVYKPEWADNPWLEVVWWGIPILIIIVLSVVTYLTSHSLDPYRAIESDKPTVKVQVVALQWKWLFIYPDYGVATINDLTIPVDHPVHFSLSADAPMSAFWIPALGSQIYSMNAMTSQLNLIANEKGVYKGYNTNINGEGYAKMEFDTNVVSEEDFDSWHKSHAKDAHLLDKNYLTEISKPSTPEKPMYMRVEDDNLYNSVIMKYMKHHSAEPQHEATADMGPPQPYHEVTGERIYPDGYKHNYHYEGSH